MCKVQKTFGELWFHFGRLVFKALHINKFLMGLVDRALLFKIEEKKNEKGACEKLPLVIV